jgi:hypothetical protein
MSGERKEKITKEFDIFCSLSQQKKKDSSIKGTVKVVSAVSSASYCR